MGLVLCREGAAAILDQALNNGWDLELCLFDNDVTPGETDLGDSTLPFSEPVTGYPGSISLTSSAAAWTVTEGDLTTNSFAAYDEQTFTFTAGASGTIYGYFIIDEATSPDTLVWAERLPISKPYENGTSVLITPRIELSTKED